MNNWTQQVRAMIPEDPIWAALLALSVAFLATLLIKPFLKLISVRLRQMMNRSTSPWNNVWLDLVDGFRFSVIFIWALHLITRPLSIPDYAHKILSFALIAATIYQVVLWGLHILRNWQKLFLAPKIAQDPSSSAALGLLYTATQIGFLVVIVLIGLSNLGVNISALLAGLGVGGIAVALAAQNILGDLLASISIILDKPFVVGDFVVSGSERGTVEHIGIKTTRLRSLSGEELIVANKDLLESRVRNFKSLWQRRVVHRFGVVYSTPADTLEKIPDWVRELVENQEMLRFDRCHLIGYGASSLDFELVFFVKDPDYNTYMDLQQSLLLNILRKLSVEKVEFAFPTQSIHIEKLPAINREV